MKYHPRVFAGLSICTTGLDVGVKEQVRKIVVACGGHFHDDFNPSVTTHLIAQAVGSLKHRVAVAHALPVVSPRWVFESYRAQTVLNVTDFGLHLLEGVGICTTGLTLDEQRTVEQVAAAHGALYDGRLELGVTSVLIAKHPQGAKYEAAVANDIPVVHLGWLDACLEREMVVDEADFLVRPPAERTRVEDEKRALEVMAALPALVDKYQRMHKDADASCMYLFDSCVVYLVGFSPTMHTLLQQFVRTGMGTIYHDLVVQHVTHVIVSACLDKTPTLETLRARVRAASAEHEVSFVSSAWVQDSIQFLELQPEALYPVDGERIMPLSAPCPIETSVSAPCPIETTSGARPADGAPPPCTTTTTTTTPIFHGYTFLLLCHDPDDPHVIAPLLQRLQSAQSGAEAIALAAIDFPRIHPNDFAFMSHAVVCTGANLDESKSRDMQAQIHAIQRTRRQGNDEKHPKNRQRMLQFVSDLWVHCCLAARTKLSFASHALFHASTNVARPLFRTCVPLAAFHTVVATTSVYRDLEQLVIVQLVRMAGARVTTRLGTHTTHLICRAPFGMKYDKARQRNLHVVNARWILESLVAGERLREDLPAFQVVDDDNAVRPTDTM